VKHLRPVVFGLLALALCAAPVAVAQAAQPGGASFTPVHRAGGLSGSELFGEGWAVTMDPAVFGTCIALGPKGNVIAPIASFEDLTVSCTVKPGTPLYFFFGSECSDVEEPPFFGADEEAQRACALAFDEGFFVSASLVLDGGEPVATLAPRFEVFSPQMTVELPPDNILGVPPQTATFVAHGWAGMLRGLRPGEHTLLLSVTDVDGSTTTAEVTIDVVPPGHAG
jgi:hypothetical protein